MGRTRHGRGVRRRLRKVRSLTESFRIRLAERRDLSAVAAIERAAGEAFRGIGMATIADDEPYTDEEIDPYLRDDRA